MQYEVEQKFRVAGLNAVQDALHELEVQFDTATDQVDCYFAHPSRDFAKTDEAFRIRSVGPRNFVTYKGPKIDLETKTRRELEMPLVDGGEYRARFAELLVALGFERRAEVRKHRRTATMDWEGMRVEVALDVVEGAGEFVELEIGADESALDAARSALRSLSNRLGLHDNERRSYLELVLENREGE